MQTATQIAYMERQRIEKQAKAAFAAVAQQEFPVGCEVRWIHAFKRKEGQDVPQYLSGVVKDHGYRGSEYFRIKRSTGTEYDIAAHRLEPVRSNTALSGARRDTG